MKTLNVLFLLASSLLSFTQGYKIKCSLSYTTKVPEKCISIVNKNEISLRLFTAINPGIDCDKVIPTDTEICIKGVPPTISMDGTCGPNKGSCPYGECCNEGKCGTSKAFCTATTCDPIYGICGTSAGNKSSKSTVEDYDGKSITTISKLFSMSNTEAKEFYKEGNNIIENFEKAFIDSVNNNLPVKSCHMRCKEVQEKYIDVFNENVKGIKSSSFTFTRYNKFLSAMGSNTINKTDLLDFCLNQCFVIKEVNEYLDENKKYEKSLNKRATNSRRDKTKCYPPSEAKFVTTYNYLNGYNKYTEASDSVITALTFVNGCSVPVIKDLYNENNRGLFVPACNVHDICYGCQGGKDKCDSTFYTHMKEICKNQKKNSLICRATAATFYAAVKIGANKNYKACSNNVTSRSCAYCGASVIQNSLLKTPYYTI